jgi:hypothetical protein
MIKLSGENIYAQDYIPAPPSDVLNIFLCAF